MTEDEIFLVRLALIEAGEWNWLDADADDTIPPEVFEKFNDALTILNRALRKARQ